MRVRYAAWSALLVGLMMCLAAVVPARAHATLVSSEPADGAVLQAAPARLILTYNEPVSPLVLRLVAPDGSATAVSAIVEGDSSLSVALPPLSRSGTHVLSWRVVSLDGHPVGGTVVFSIGAPSSAPVVSASAAADPSIAMVSWALKLGFYAGLFIGIGGAFFLAWLAPGAAGAGRMTVAGALVTGLLASPLLVGLQGLDALELSIAGLASLIAWKTGLESSFGATAIVAALALLAGLVSLRVASLRLARAVSLFGLVAVGLALVLSGHASSAAPRWLTRPAVFVHVVSVAFWIGSLAPLGLIMLKGAPPEAVFSRFSRAIPWAVLALIVSGAFLALVQVEEPRALLSTAYGQILCAKLALVAALLGLAAWNRFRLTPAIMSGAASPRRSLARSIAVELALVLLIFGLVASWRFTPPPRALAAASAAPTHLHIHTQKAMADVTFEPAGSGMVRANIILLTGDFGLLEAKAVTLTLENEAAGIEAISREAVRDGDAAWRVDQLPVPAGGRWKVKIDILIDDFEKTALEDEIEFKSR